MREEGNFIGTRANERSAGSINCATSRGWLKSYSFARVQCVYRDRYFSRLFCKSTRFHLGHVSLADYVLTGQYISIDNSTIPRDICLSLFVSPPLCRTLFHLAVCFVVNRSRWRTFQTPGSLCDAFWRIPSRNYLSPGQISISFSPGSHHSVECSKLCIELFDYLFPRVFNGQVGNILKWFWRMSSAAYPMSRGRMERLNLSWRDRARKQ